MSSGHDSAEIAGSASEASKIKIRDVDFTRYLSPPADTCFPPESAVASAKNHDHSGDRSAALAGRGN
jgi:hypothetical protein